MNKKIDLIDACCPMLVPSNDNETDNEFRKRWEKFDSLSERAKDILSSMETSNVIGEFVKRFNLSINNAVDISRLVRSLFFGEISQGNLTDEIQKKIPAVSYDDLRNIARIIVDKIVNATPKGRIDTSVKLANLPLSQALEKYLRLGEQLVTSSPIKLKIFPDPVRPSVKNWIAEYHSVLGAGTHGTMERGNFLYHSENAKRLSFGERQKLAVILKSLDENEPVAVDGEKQEIIFNLQPTTDNLQRTAADKTLEARSSKLEANSDFRFSYPQKLQSEQPRQKSYQHFDPYHIDPVGYPEDKPKPEPPKPPVPPSASRTEPRIEGNIVDLRG